ncbi:hypothetical protein PAXINDRAFT_75084 [Paxillus involutus ATCC 200175]|nr:hypothetical protein PAXINDRAFT_75084 [Paxillus involutus ATCC 200175]
MREWLEYEEEYLEALLRREGADGRTCSKGCGRDRVYRCADCFGRPMLCTSCCRSAHQLHPFHHMEQWSGDHFAPSSLRAAGLFCNSDMVGRGARRHQLAHLII